MLVAHKIRIYPNQEQKNLIDKSCSVQGFIYNWGLNEWQRQYKEGLKPSSFNLKKQFNNIKREQFPVVKNINSIQQIDWMNQKIKCQNNVNYTLLHN